MSPVEYSADERQILDQVVGVLHAHYGERLSRVVLFGSRARRDHTEDSDFDLLVVLKGDVDIRRESEIIEELTFPIHCEHWKVIFCHPASESRFEIDMQPLFMNIRKEGVPL